MAPGDFRDNVLAASARDRAVDIDAVDDLAEGATSLLQHRSSEIMQLEGSLRKSWKMITRFRSVFFVTLRVDSSTVSCKSFIYTVRAGRAVHISLGDLSITGVADCLIIFW